MRHEICATKIFPSGSASVPVTTVQPPNRGRQQATGDENGAGGTTSGTTDDEEKGVQTVLEEKFSTMKLVTAHLSKRSPHLMHAHNRSKLDVFRYESSARHHRGRT